MPHLDFMTPSLRYIQKLFFLKKWKISLMNMVEARHQNTHFKEWCEPLFFYRIRRVK